MQQAMRQLKYIHLAYLSKPFFLRRLYRQIRRTKCTRILEIGLQCPHRAQRMIEVAALGRSATDVTYSAIDLFELRPTAAPAGISLRLAHRQLGSTGARIQLLPGEPYSVLARKANDLLERDLILISGAEDPQVMSRAWFYLPRMLHEKSVVIQFQNEEEAAQPKFRQLPLDELHALARTHHRRAA